MKRDNIITNIGTINLNDVNFCENTLDVFIGIESVSEDIHKEIDEAVETAKANHMQIIKERFTNKSMAWTEAGVDVDLYLHIVIEDKAFSYQIEIDITDKEDGRLWTSASVEVDLSEYQAELKKVIVKAMVDNFF